MPMAMLASMVCLEMPNPRRLPAWRISGASSVDVQQSQGSVIAEEAIKRIAKLYAIEKEGCGRSTAERVAICQKKAKPVFDDLETWLHAQVVQNLWQVAAGQSHPLCTHPNAEDPTLSRQWFSGAGYGCC